MRVIAGGFGHTIFDRSSMSISVGFGFSASFFFLSQNTEPVRNSTLSAMASAAAPAFLCIEFVSKLNIAIPRYLLNVL
jgi:hypothetical protein